MTNTNDNANVRAIVLAAGQGKRMKSARAKVLHEVLGKPILSRILDALDNLALAKIHIVLGHESQQIIDFLQANPPRTPYATHIQQPQLGTGHAVQQVVPDLKGFTGTLLVTVGDAPLLTTETLAHFIRGHKLSHSVVSLLTTEVPDAKNYGRIIRDPGGRVIQIVEDKDANDEQKLIREINPAIYCFEWPQIESGLSGLQNNNKQGEYYLTDLIAWGNENDQPQSSYQTKWQEVAAVNSRAELAEAIALMKERTLAHLMTEGVTIIDPNATWIAPEATIGPDTTVLPGCYIMGDVTIGSGCTIGPNTVMHGPVRVGDRTSVAQSLVVNSTVGNECRIGPFSHLREHTVIGDKCRVGNFVEIKKSKVANNTNASHLSYVGDSTLGSKVNIGAGTITANYDHYTGKKFNTVIEDGASTGSNSVLVAPITVGKEASVAAGTVATKDIPPGALAVGRARQENKEGFAERKRRSK